MARVGYRLRSLLIVTLLIGYTAGIFEGPKFGRTEFYPFFSWSLFSYTHSIRNDVAILVRKIDGNTLAKPTSYYNLPARFTHFPGGKVRMRKMLSDIYAANVNQDRAHQNRLIRKYENIYFRSANSVEYQFSVIRYEPIERLKTGKFEVVRTIHEGIYEAD